MDKRPINRAGANELLEALTAKVFGASDRRALEMYRHAVGYHLLGIDLDSAIREFAISGPPLIETLCDNLLDLACEFAQGVSDGNFHFVGTVGDLSWLLAYGDGFYVEGQITTPQLRFAVAQPNLWLLKNVDTQPLTMRRVRFTSSFEDCTQLDLSAVEELRVAPGALLQVNGFEELVWPASQGELFMRLMSLPVGAYEVVFDLETGARIGKFATDIRVATIENVLRIMGFAREDKARALADEMRRHNLRELRWSALNYYWRLAPSDLTPVLAAFAGDSDQGIRKIATGALLARGAE